MAAMAAAQHKQMPKDALVIVSILKELGVTDYEPRVINQLLEFTYRYVTNVLDDAKVYANHAKKKTIDLEDVRLAVGMHCDKSFTNPPPRDILLEVARIKNNTPLPLVKPHCGIRLPPDRYCLNSCNYRLKSMAPKKFGHSASGASYSLQPGSMKLSTKPTPQIQLVKRQSNPSIATVPRTLSLSAPKPVIKFSPAGGLPQQKIMSSGVKTHVQMTGPGHIEVSSVKMETEEEFTGLKRKREPDEFDAL